MRQEIKKLEHAFLNGEQYILRARGGDDVAAERLSFLRNLSDHASTKANRRGAVDRDVTWSTSRLINPEAAR